MQKGDFKMSELARIYLIHDFIEFIIEKGFDKIDYDNITDFEIIMKEDEDTIYYDLPFDVLDKELLDFAEYIKIEQD